MPILRGHDLAVVVVHHARKNGPAGVQAGQGLRGSGDFHAWGDSNLYLRRQQSQLVLTVEHRAAKAPEPLSLLLAQGESGGDAHLEIVGGSAAAVGEPSVAGSELGEAILRALDQANAPLQRGELRAAVRVRNERLGDALQRLAASGAIQRRGEGWVRAAPAVPIPAL
jgi:hypothetical protein